MKIKFRYILVLLPLILFTSLSFTGKEIGFSTNFDESWIKTDTIPPSKAELKQMKAQKKIEQEIKKAKYREAKEKSKMYANQAKNIRTQNESGTNQDNTKEKKHGEVTAGNTKTANTEKSASKTKPAPVVKTSSPLIAESQEKKKVKSTPTKNQNNAFVNAVIPEPVIPDDPKNRNRGKTCEFSYNVTDPITGQTKSALEKRHFFGFTEKELRQFMKDEDYLNCTGYLSQVTGVKTLNVTFVIDSPYAKDEYGSIQAGTQMIIKLLNGETVTLLSEKYDSGSLSRRTGKTTYKTLFIVSARDEKVLAKSEVDIVRMVWGTGYEDYEVYELDFFIDQIACLNGTN
ncbi:MAG: hypothetical protein AAF502_20130 [Bacteroidota bacterium]